MHILIVTIHDRKKTTNATFKLLYYINIFNDKTYKDDNLLLKITDFRICDFQSS